MLTGADTGFQKGGRGGGGSGKLSSSKTWFIHLHGHNVFFSGPEVQLQLGGRGGGVSQVKHHFFNPTTTIILRDPCGTITP